MWPVDKLHTNITLQVLFQDSKEPLHTSFLIDTGSQVTLLKGNYQSNNKISIEGITKNSITASGRRGTILYKGLKIATTFSIHPSLENLLGMDTLPNLIDIIEKSPRLHSNAN